VDIVDYTAAYRDLCLEMFLSNTPAFFAHEELPLFKSWLDDLEKGGLGKKGALYDYVMIDGNTAVACGGFHVSAEDQKATMAWGMVHRAYHRKGIGKEFLNFRIRRIRQMFPHSHIALDTTQFSVGFYEKQGFVVTKFTSDFYAPGMDRYDMELRNDNVIL
jgi:ribosomal-protein-alanine N-acetyltransferase